MQCLIKVRIICLSILLSNLFIFADDASYSEKKAFINVSKQITVIHQHDWTATTIISRRKMYFGTQDPFSIKNNYAYLECIDNQSNRIIFVKPTPALSFLYVTSDQKYIIGLSNIKYLNPCQLVIFDRSGKLVFSKSISVREVKLNTSEFDHFQNKFKRDVAKLKGMKKIDYFGDHIYISNVSFPLLSKKAREYLRSWKSASHLSKNFSESVTNFIDWYKEPNPEIQLKYENGTISAISLLDPAGERFEIEIKSLIN